MKRWIPLLAALAAMVLLTLQPQAASKGVQAGLSLCAGTVIPSLFPFFVVISLLLQLGLADSLQGVCGPIMGPLFHMRGACALPLLAGLLGGYPRGARTAAGVYAPGGPAPPGAALGPPGGGGGGGGAPPGGGPPPLGCTPRGG